MYSITYICFSCISNLVHIIRAVARTLKPRLWTVHIQECKRRNPDSQLNAHVCVTAGERTLSSVQELECCHPNTQLRSACIAVTCRWRWTSLLSGWLWPRWSSRRRRPPSWPPRQSSTGLTGHNPMLTNALPDIFLCFTYRSMRFSYFFFCFSWIEPLWTRDSYLKIVANITGDSDILLRVHTSTRSKI